MRIVIHDYAGHAFPISLSRALAARGHDVVHAFASSLQTPRGDLSLRPNDSPTLAFKEIPMDPAYSRYKYSFHRRRGMEVRYGKAVADFIKEWKPDAVLSGNTPTETQEPISRAAVACNGRFYYWVQDFYSLAVDRILRRKIPVAGAWIGAWYRHLDRRQFERSSRVIAITGDFSPILSREFGVDGSRIAVVPNWALIEELPCLPKDNSWSRRHALHDKFVYLYSGTIGMKHNPALILELAKRNAGYGRTIEAMITNLPPSQVIHYIYCLREVKGPWKKEERQRFFAWFPKLLGRDGGASYGGFIVDLRNQTIANAAADERPWLEEIVRSTPPRNVLAGLPAAKGPGRAWTVADVERIAAAGFEKANRENGKTMFKAALCAACHRFGGEGGSAGPDLSTVAGRFTARDLAESIIEPGKIISDQYEFTQITKTDGTSIIGKIVEETERQTIIAISPFDMSQTMSIPTKTIREKSPSPASPMPAGLINQLNEEDLRDLLAYLMGS